MSQFLFLIALHIFENCYYLLLLGVRMRADSRERLKSGRTVNKPLAICTMLEMITAGNYEEKERIAIISCNYKLFSN